MQLKNVITGVLVALTAAVGQAQAMNGRATWYYQYGVAGSCGEYHSDGDFIAAVGFAWGDNAQCNRPVTVSWNGATITVVVKDICQGCGPNDIDLSVGAFQALTGGNLDIGVLNGAEWEWA